MAESCTPSSSSLPSSYWNVLWPQLSGRSCPAGRLVRHAAAHAGCEACGWRLWARPPGARSIQEPVSDLLGQLLRYQVLAVEPAAHMCHQLCQLRRRLRGIAPPLQLGTEPAAYAASGPVTCRLSFQAGSYDQIGRRRTSRGITLPQLSPSRGASAPDGENPREWLVIGLGDDV
jgi:hypothetical protein